MTEGSMMMTNGNVGKQRVSFCEEANTLQSIEFDFSQDERVAVWYSQEEFQQMKSNGLQTLTRRKETPLSCCHRDESCCIRGLEKNGKHTQKHRRQALRSMVQMYRQMQAVPCQSTRDEDERSEILRSYCLSKTRYAQDNAKYVAAQDAAAVRSNDWVICGCRELVSTQSSPVSWRHATGYSPRQSKVANNNDNDDKALSMSTVSNTRSPLVQQNRLPLRAMTA
jgi:hypothetical protein